MMYSTVIDVRNALAPGGQADPSTAASLGEPQILDAIAQADSKIDLHVQPRYSIPTEEIEQGDPPVTVTVAKKPVRYWSRDIAAFLAALTFNKHKDIGPDDPIRLRFNAAMNDLASVSNGSLLLPFPPPELVGSAVTVVNQYTGRLFGPEDFGLGYEGHVRRDGTWPGGPA